MNHIYLKKIFLHVYVDEHFVTHMYSLIQFPKPEFVNVLSVECITKVDIKQLDIN